MEYLNTQHRRNVRGFEMWVFCGGFPVNVVTTPLVFLDRMSTTW
jgi:hypothetical protein